MARRPKQPNDQLRELITEAGFSHKGLARRVNDAGSTYGLSGLSYDHSSVVRWLGGQQPKPPVPALLADVVTARIGRTVTPTDLGMPCDNVLPDLGLAFPLTWQESVHNITGLLRHDVARRNFLLGAGYAVGAFAGPAMRWLTAPTDDAPVGHGFRQVGVSDVDAVREVTTAFRRLDNRWGGGYPRAMVVQYLHDEIPPLLAGRYTEPVGRSLLAGVSELTHLAAWMAFDLELQGLAQRYMIQALRFARAAGDYAFGGEVLAAMSQQALYVDHADEAVDLARAAHLSARKAAVPALVSETLLTEARALAALGDRCGSMRALTAGERAMDRHDPAEVPSWLGYYDVAYLSAQLGHCLRDLGDLDAAERHAHQSLRMVDGYTRGRAFNVTLLASIHTEQHELEQASRVGTQAVGLAAEVKSRRARRRLGDLTVRLDPHSSVPAVRGFLEQVQPLNDH